MDLKGNRRVIVLSEAVGAVVVLGALSLINSDAAGVLTAGITTIGGLGLAYITGDSYVKGKSNESTKPPVQ